MINLNGEKITEAPADGKYGVITYDGKNFGVKWSDQTVAYDANNAPTWTGKVYVKAKEDFLGGNTINTNKGTDDKFVPKKAIVDGVEYDLKDSDKTKLTRPFETPYVNVDELSMTQHNTEWTVYLGTEVDPAKQLAALLDNIRIREVVSKSSNYMITDKDAMLGNSSTDDSESFPLKQAAETPVLSAEEWEDLLESGTLSMPYSAYGHENVGTLILSFTKNGSGADFKEHNTSETGRAVETYNITAIYAPAQERDVVYHTTPGGSPGASTGNMRSENMHSINVYAKQLTINKVDQANNPIASPATFKLFRKAVDGDRDTDYVTEANLPACLPVVNNYILVDTLTTSNGTVTTGNLNDSYEYYLVETIAPPGYNLLSGYFTVSVDTESTYTKTLAPSETSASPWDPWVLSDWIENSSVKVDGVGEGMSGYVEYNEGKGKGYTADAESAAVAYKIRNDAGVALPSTGGSGTDIFYILGGILTALAGGLLLIKRNREAA